MRPNDLAGRRASVFVWLAVDRLLPVERVRVKLQPLHSNRSFWIIAQPRDDAHRRPLCLSRGRLVDVTPMGGLARKRAERLMGEERFWRRFRGRSSRGFSRARFLWRESLLAEAAFGSGPTNWLAACKCTSTSTRTHAHKTRPRNLPFRRLCPLTRIRPLFRGGSQAHRRCELTQTTNKSHSLLPLRREAPHSFARPLDGSPRGG